MSMVTLVPSAARTVSGDSGALSQHLETCEAAILVLDVTAAAAAAGDTLDVFIQHAVDDGTIWDDFAHVTQVLGNGGAKRVLAFWSRRIAPTTAVKAPQDAALAVGVQQGPVGALWRVKWVIAGSTPSFTFSVSVDRHR